MKLADGTLLRAELNDVSGPSRDDLIMLFNNTVFPSGLENTLYFFTDTNVTVVNNHLSLSTAQFKRAAESFSFFTFGRVSEDNLPGFSAAMQTYLRNQGLYKIIELTTFNMN